VVDDPAGLGLLAQAASRNATSPLPPLDSRMRTFGILMALATCAETSPHRHGTTKFGTNTSERGEEKGGEEDGREEESIVSGSEAEGQAPCGS
jgi:hypothetical protein